MKKFLLLHELEVSQMIEDNSRISDRIDTEPADTETSIPLDGGNSVETAFPDNSSSGNSSPDHTDSEGSSSEEKDSPNDSEEDFDLRKEVISWLLSLAFVIVAVLIINNFIIVNAQVPSSSMENTIMPGNRLIGTRFSYWFSEPERGDIVIFHYPLDEKIIYIKRVIGLPGETVRIEDGKIYINDSETPLDEPYLKEEWLVENTGFSYTIPEDCWLMLGDNRNNSADSRYWPQKALEEGLVSSIEEGREKYSFVHSDQIMARAVFRYWGGFKVLTD
jgi:signal peptidase I